MLGTDHVVLCYMCIYTCLAVICLDHLTFFFLEAQDLKQEERLQELESCSGLGSTSDDTEVREVSSRPSTPGLSVVSGIRHSYVTLHLVLLRL